MLLAKYKDPRCILSYKHHHRLSGRLHNQKRSERFGSRMVVSPAKKERLLKDQEGLCAMCDEPMGKDCTVDHMLRLADGGDSDIKNLQLLHRKCHDLKEKKYDKENWAKARKGAVLECETLSQDKLQAINWEELRKANEKRNSEGRKLLWKVRKLWAT